MMPGKSSRVLLTISPSDLVMSMGPMSPILNRPADSRRLTAKAPKGPSWPQKETCERIKNGQQRGWNETRKQGVRKTYNDGSRHRLRVHARLEAVGKRDKGVVCHDTVDARDTVGVLLDDEVLCAGSIEQLDVGEGQRLREDRRGEESSVLDDDVRSFVLVRHLELVEDLVRRLADDHGRHELATEPSATARGDRSLEDGNAQVGPGLAELVGTRQSSRSSANDDDIRDGCLRGVRSTLQPSRNLDTCSPAFIMSS